jgi:hypothetical protein
MYSIEHLDHIEVFENDNRPVAKVYDDRVTFNDGTEFTYKGFTLREMVKLIVYGARAI